MRHSPRWIAVIVAALVLAFAATSALGATSARAAPKVVDLGIHLGAGSTKERAFVTPVGERVTTNVSGLRFYLTVIVGFESSREPASATFRLELPDGIRWTDLLKPSERCTTTTSAVLCETTLDDATTGQFDSWAWRVVASRPGSYTFKATITEMSAPDARPSDNDTSLTVAVSEGVTLGAPRMTPAKPTAGALVAATVRVTSGGRPVRPSCVGCTGSIRGRTIRGVAKVSTGSATCSYRPPKTAKGKTLRGSISITARGERFRKSFSAKLR